MRIRTRLTLQFALIVAAILLLGSISIYFVSADYRKEEFYTRLESRALSTANLLIQVDEVDTRLLKIIDRKSVALVDENVVIYNYLNHNIYRSNEDTINIITSALLNEIRLEGKVRFSVGKKEALGMRYIDRYNRFVVIAIAYDRYGYRKLVNLRIVLLIVSVLSVLLAIVAGWIFASQALKPISKVIKQVDAISGSNMDARVDEGNSKDEISNMAHTFNKMLDRLEKAFELQKSFVSNSSHELRTPLTAITGQIEVTLLNRREKEEYEAVLQSVLEDIKNLTALTNGLLELAQASRDFSDIQVAYIRIDELLWMARTDLIKNNPGYEASIHFDDLPYEEDRLLVLGSESLLKTALLNIMDNACKYSKDHKVDVQLEFGQTQVCLRFADKGIGISKEEVGMLFQPFFRASNTNKVKGHGLGLSLTEKIIKLHSGEIKITSVLHEGTTVEIKLPVGGSEV